jgi:hypothetical protein
MDSKLIRDVLDEVANALQTAAPLATSVRQGLGERAQHAATLDAIARAVRAIKRLHPACSRL